MLIVLNLIIIDIYIFTEPIDSSTKLHTIVRVSEHALQMQISLETTHEFGEELH